MSKRDENLEKSLDILFDMDDSGTLDKDEKNMKEDFVRSWEAIEKDTKEKS